MKVEYFKLVLFKVCFKMWIEVLEKGNMSIGNFKRGIDKFEYVIFFFKVYLVGLGSW